MSARDDLSLEAVEFIRFCYRRRRAGWPEIYDEMCAVAGRGLYRGWTRDELAAHGINFSLAGMPALASFVRRVIVDEVPLCDATSRRRGTTVAAGVRDVAEQASRLVGIRPRPVAAPVGGGYADGDETGEPNDVSPPLATVLGALA